MSLPFREALYRVGGWRCAMSDETTSAIEAGIRSAFTAYSREDDPDWRSATWIKPDECSHLTQCILKELAAKGFEIVKKAN